MYSEGPTSQAQVDSDEYDCELIGINDLGSVHIHGPFGNKDSDVKIAYLIGMHPLESKSHRALFDKLTSADNLNYCYYIYNINVLDKTSQSEGRMEGQLLAREFVTQNIIHEKYDLFLDIHSNRGSKGPAQYEISNFIFAPGFDDISTEYVDEILSKFDEMCFYVPEYRSSPSFITEVTSANGIPTIIYECCTFDEIEVTCDLALKLINIVDNLKFK